MPPSADDNIIVAIPVHIAGGPGGIAEAVIIVFTGRRPVGISTETGGGAKVDADLTAVSLVQIAGDDNIVIAIAVHIPGGADIVAPVVPERIVPDPHRGPHR